MADLTARIKPKKSSTAGEVPQAADLEVAELAVNTADGKLFVKHTDNSIKEISGGGGSSFGDVSPYTPVLGTYATRFTYNSVPPTDQWSSNGTQLIFAQVSGNGLDLNAKFGNTNPGTIGVSDDGSTFTYYTCTTWDAFTTYFRATLDGLDEQAFYDAGDRPIWINFGPQTNPAEGTTLVYESTGDHFKIKKNSISNQSDFGYVKDVAAYRFTFDTADTPTPASGLATKWTGSLDDVIWLSTTDKDSLNAETDLYSLVSGSPVVMSVNGTIVFSGTLLNALNQNTSRIALQFSTVQSWITNLQAGDIVGIKSDTVFTAQAAALAIEDGQVLTWNNANSQWESANPVVDSNTTTAGAGSSAISNIVTISQVDYDALGTPDANTIYFIV